MVLVIFDVDGTLVYSDRADSRCFADTYQSVYQRPFPTIDWRQYPHVSDTTIFKNVIEQHFDRTPDAAEEAAFRQKFTNNITLNRQRTPERFHCVPHAPRMIRRLLQDDRFRVGVATGGWTAPARVKMNFVGIPHEDLVVTGADGKITRDDIINDTMIKAGGRKQYDHVVYVGDAIWDFQTTRRMRMPLIGIRHRGDVEFFHQLGVSQVLIDYENYEQFLNYCLHPEPVPSGH